MKETKPATLSARAWFDSVAHPGTSWPEQNDYQLMSRSNVGVAISGGGSRSYLCALGYLRGLSDLGLMHKARYISGVSGGAWATLVYTYYQPGVPGVATTDEELLGDILPPEKCTLATLSQMNDTCARKATTHDFYETLVGNFFEHKSLPSAWIHQVWHQFVGPIGVGFNTSFTWNQSTLQDILDRNPGLSPEDFVLPASPDRPFPLFVTTLEGPVEAAPFPEKERQFVGYDVTPLYLGLHDLRNRSFPRYGGGPNITKLVGGIMEPFAFGGQAPDTGLHHPHGVLDVPYSKLYSLNEAAATSSYFLGAAVTTLGPLPFRRADKLGIVYPMWPVADARGKPPTTDMILSDGGSVVQPDLIGMIKRNVSSIVALFNLEKPLKPKEKWDPTQRPPNPDDVDNDFPAFFGFSNDDDTELGYDLHRNQIFAKEDFVHVVVELQTSQAAGRGAVAQTTHKTVENAFWGVPAGIEVMVTWVYLSRAVKWEEALPEDVRKKFPLDPSPDVLPGSDAGLEWINFPNFNTFTQLTIAAQPANALSNLCGWVVQQNAEIFKKAFDVDSD